MKTKKTILQQFESITKINIFEIAVIDRRTNEREYISFNIEITEDKLQATHEALTKQESESEKIAFKSVEIEGYFSLDENLQALYDECINAITNSEYFELAED